MPDVFLRDSSKCTLRLNYAKLADIGQGEKKTPDKFLDRLQEALCKFTNVDPESTEEGMVLKVDFSLTQLKISAVSYKNRRLDQISLQKTVQLSQMVYHGKEYKEENRRKKKKPGQRPKPQQWLLDPL